MGFGDTQSGFGQSKKEGEGSFGASTGFGASGSGTGFGGSSGFGGKSSGFGSGRTFGGTEAGTGNDGATGFGSAPEGSGFGGNKGFGGAKSFGGASENRGFGSNTGSGFGSGGGFGGSTGGFGGQGGGGGGFGQGGGGGGERPRGCFNCGEEGHRSAECSQPRKPREGGGRGCFNCGEEGHRSADCTQPKKPREGGGRGGAFGGNSGGGGFGGSSGFGGNGSGFGGSAGGFGGQGGGGGFGQGGGERPRGCFNCGEEGHRSADCTQPRKPREGGGGRGCFNCGEEGHRSADCTQPKKAREGGGRGFGGGGFGGATGGGGGFGAATGGGGFGGGGFGSSGGGGGAFGNRPSNDNERPRGCFNCGQEGHRSNECTEPRKPRENGEGSKPASNYVPEDIPDEELFKMRITEGDRFKEFFDAEVKLTSAGKLIQIQPISTFDELDLPPQVKANVQEAGYKKPTPIQQYAMAIVKAKMDLMACAQTGSGKTAAFLLPIIRELIVSDDLASSMAGTASPRCIVVAPTRELADQICKEGRKFLRNTILKIESVYGGVQVGFAKSRLAMGPTIVVGTMGRMLHFIEEKTISMDEVRYIVLDEADRMLESQGFAEDVRKMINLGPPKQKRTTLMFSATFPEEVQQLAMEHLKSDHAMLAVDKIGSANRCITQEFIEITGDRSKKRDALLQLLNIDLEKYKLIDDSMFQKKTIVFVNRKAFADQLGMTLSEAGLASVTMHGAREQKQRSEALADFRSGKKPVLIATAVAERGLDIQGVDHVINYDLPQCKEDYVHRIGRTGRVGNAGRATSFFDPTDTNDVGLAASLVRLLAEAHQIVPEFLQTAAGENPNAVTGFSMSGGFGVAAPNAGVEEEW